MALTDLAMKVRLGKELDSLKKSARSTKLSVIGDVPSRTERLLNIKSILEADTEIFSADDVAEIDEIIQFQNSEIIEAISTLTEGDKRQILVGILESDGYTVTQPAE